MMQSLPTGSEKAARRFRFYADGHTSTKRIAGAAAAAAVLLLTGCGGSSASLSAVGTAEPTVTASATATAKPTPISKTPCSSVDSQKFAGSATYNCTRDESGALIWLEASEARALKNKLSAEAAAKAAAEKAAADKAAADKAAAEKAAADKAAADAAAQEAARQAADAKAAQDAAAAQAAAEAAAKAAQPAPKAVPVAPAAGAGCDPNYSGCVPIASDVDCAGGSGNGPAYVRGPVQVIGNDIYGLDRDGDGLGCE